MELHENSGYYSMNNLSTVDLVDNIARALQQYAQLKPQNTALFFKTGPGQYAEFDQFLGVSVKDLRQMAQQWKALSLEALELLLSSAWNEHRLLALIVLCHQYQRGSSEDKKACYEFYLNHLHRVNNWNLVDSSAHLILGAHLLDQDKSLLFQLAHSEVLWDRRIAIVATWHFIRQRQLNTTFEIAGQLLSDPEDLIHKAVGWMLREAGKKDPAQLRHFLTAQAHSMPRTMLRYAIEKFSGPEQKLFLLHGKKPL